MLFQVVMQPAAKHMLEKISDRSIRQRIADRINTLAVEPEKVGKPLIKDLAGYRSIRAAGQRYRIIYSIQPKNIVSVAALGIRKEGDKNDIYNLARKMVRLGLIG